MQTIYKYIKQDLKRGLGKIRVAKKYNNTMLTAVKSRVHCTIVFILHIEVSGYSTVKLLRLHLSSGDDGPRVAVV